VNLDLYALYNGWKKIEEYNPSGEDNAQYATKDGTPAWLTLNFKSSVAINKILSLQAGVENILDRNYRYFASGFSAPGRNFILALRCGF
jgi:hemoglobin/transferrin/lactoferrin receptor protein